MVLSSFGAKLVGESGILRLMDDIGRPLPSGLEACLLGGGNPARIPEVESLYRAEMERLLAERGAFEDAIGRYDAPQGRVSFLEAIADFLRGRYGWDVGPENVAVTNGSQSAFFYLFNLLSGAEPSRRTILFPLVPEYVGYADQGIDHGTFVTLPARHQSFDDRSFKYSIDLDLVDRYLAAHPEVGAICVSRPTNPTGNVLTDAEARPSLPSRAGAGYRSSSTTPTVFLSRTSSSPTAWAFPTALSPSRAGNPASSSR
jgi:valine--pyruvate aminotransferase